MKLFNEKFANQKFVTAKKEFAADERGVMDVDDKEMAEFFMNQGWKKFGKIKEDDVEPKAEPKEVEPKSKDEGEDKKAKPEPKSKPAKGGKKPVFSRRSK